MSVNVTALSIVGEEEVWKIQQGYPGGFFLALTGMCANYLLDGKS